MTSTFELDHQVAGLTLLRNAGLAVLPDENGFVPPNPPLPYVLVYTSVSWPREGDANALDGLSVTCSVRFYAHCIAESEYAALQYAGMVREAWLDQRPTVAGRNCGQLGFESDAGGPANRSELAAAPRYDMTVVYSMISAPG